MARRTFAIGDVHGELGHLRLLLAKLPPLGPEDTLVFLGDYVDRGPKSAEVVARIRALDRELGCRVVCLRGNHEDGWLRVVDHGWPGFLLPRSNGCLETVRSFDGREPPASQQLPTAEDIDRMERGACLPPDVLAWMRSLPTWYEDEHALYVHAGLEQRDGRFLHPSETESTASHLWTRSEAFFRDYRGKRVVVGHTVTELLPPELSSYTPADPTDLWAGPCVVAIDTGAGVGGFLTAVELPAERVYESRSLE